MKVLEYYEAYLRDDPRVSVPINADQKWRRLLKITKKDFEMKKSSRINF